MMVSERGGGGGGGGEATPTLGSLYFVSGVSALLRWTFYFIQCNSCYTLTCPRTHMYIHTHTHTHTLPLAITFEGVVAVQKLGNIRLSRSSELCSTASCLE